MTVRKCPPLVDNAKHLKELCSHLEGQPVVAFDAEMDSYYSYYTKLCLVQISTTEADWLVDPLVGLDLSVLNEVTTNPGQVKIFHAGENDIPYFKKFCDLEFVNVFDTHLVARILALPTASLAGLLSEFFEVELDKRFQRADWRVRPLPPDQAEYARLDTRYLPKLREILLEQLDEEDRLEEARSECERIVHAEMREKEFDPDSWAKLKGVRELAADRRAVLRELYLWREHKAQELDEASFRVAPDHFLFGLARKAPRNRDKLLSWARHGSARRYTDEILEAIHIGLDTGVIDLPMRKKSRKEDLSPRQQRAYNRLRSWRNEESEQRGVEPDRVATNRLLKAVARQLPGNLDQLKKVDGMEPWRVGMYGQTILEQVKE
ncbi:MAG: HRDC domain-containing protein [Candidatus Eremiobacteraeota bacterium]|nr:HRDC domain-containing protein [Candidatus Eremiobacteraeota bacterium]